MIFPEYISVPPVNTSSTSSSEQESIAVSTKVGNVTQESMSVLSSITGQSNSTQESLLSIPQTVNLEQESGGGLLNATFTASRISGPAPLAVHFDASGTSHSAYPESWRQLLFVWDFGDPTPPTGLSTWSYGNQQYNSRNADTGPFAAHVFDPTGDSLPPSNDVNYTVTLTVYDKDGNSAQSTIQITVQTDANAGITDLNCASTNTDFTGAPALSDPRWTTVTYFSNQTGDDIESILASNTRTLLHDGQTFVRTGTGNVDINNAVLGKFGTGANPLIQRTTNVEILGFGNTNVGGPRYDTFTWMYVDLDGQNFPQQECLFVRQVDHYLFYRHSVFNSGDFIQTIEALPYGNDPARMPQVFTVDLYIEPFTFGGGDYQWFGVFTRGANLGCYWGTPSGGEHTIRNQYTGRCVISHNTLEGPNNNAKTCQRIHAPTGVGTNTYTYVGYNVYDVTTYGSGCCIEIGPQSDQVAAENVERVIVEGCYFVVTQNLGTNRFIWLMAVECSIRNNIGFCDNGETNDLFLRIDRRGNEQNPRDNWIENNSHYDPNSPVSINIGTSVATNNVLRNHIAHGPSSLISDSGTGTIIENNRLGSPTWATDPPIAGDDTDFRLAGGSPAINAGTTNGFALSDYRGPITTVNVRHLLSTPDQGAYEES